MKMTFRPILMILLVLLTAANTKAQLSAGLRGGVNLANYNNNDPVLRYKPKTAPGLALLLNYALNPSFSIQIEPGLAQWSAQLENLQTAPNYTVEFKYRIFMNYMEVPLLFQYKPQFGKLQAVFSFGPEARFLAKPLKTKTKRTAYSNGQIVDQLDRVDVYKGEMGLRKFDAGLVAGAGVLYPVGSVKLMAEGRYHYGLSNVYGKRINEFNKAYVRGISAHLGILVPLGK